MEKKLIFTQKIRDAIDKRHRAETDMERKERFYRLCDRNEIADEAETRNGEISCRK